MKEILIRAKLEDIKAYKIASELSEGVQWVESADSIAGNIAEGFGSVYESVHWTKKAKMRRLVAIGITEKKLKK